MRSSRSPETSLAPGESVDLFLDGRLRLIQSKDGYRFSVDALLLAQFATVKKGGVVVDLGTGCGIIPLVLLLTRSVRRTYGLEIQAELAAQAERNAALNGFQSRMEIIRGDIRNPPFKSGMADVVICNPPFRQVSTGRINPDVRRAIARHEILASLDHILTASRRLLRAKGRLAMVYPASRAADLMDAMRQHGLEPKRMQVIYPDPGTRAKRVLMEGCAEGAAGLVIEPPIIGQGNFSL